MVTYYKYNSNPDQNDNWKEELGIALTSAAAGLTKWPGAKNYVNFAIATFSSSGSGTVAENLALELQYIKERNVKN